MNDLPHSAIIFENSRFLKHSDFKMFLVYRLSENRELVKTPIWHVNESNDVKGSGQLIFHHATYTIWDIC